MECKEEFRPSGREMRYVEYGLSCILQREAELLDDHGRNYCFHKGRNKDARGTEDSLNVTAQKVDDSRCTGNNRRSMLCAKRAWMTTRTRHLERFAPSRYRTNTAHPLLRSHIIFFTLFVVGSVIYTLYQAYYTTYAKDRYR